MRFPRELDAVLVFLSLDVTLTNFFPYRFSLSHDLILPIWKSNVSITLMIDKKAKRYVYLVYIFAYSLNLCV